MVVTLEGGCRVSDMRDGDPLVEGTLRLWRQIGRATGADAISLNVMEFASGISPAIRNDQCDQILYLLEQTQQKASQIRLFIDGESYDVCPDTGVYIRPGQTFAIDNRGAESLIIISSQCPDPNRAPQFVPPGNVISPKSEDARIIRLADRIPQSTADRWYRVMVDDEVGSTQVTQFVGSIPPGRAPNHFHNYEEVLFILRGEGEMWAGETHTPLAAGSCIYLPRKQVHCVENTGEGELRLLGIFYPAGSPSVRYQA
jgi:mannose-6-phosphate isomerase-like protein (cupin superfamily)